MIGLAVCAKPLVELILTEKWLPCVPFLRIFCITYIFYPIHTANLNSIKAMGRSDLFLKMEIIKKIVGITLICITAPISTLAMGYSLLVSSVVSQIINSWPNRILLNYSYKDQLKDIFPHIGLSCLMGGSIYFINFLEFSDLVTLLIQIPLGVVIYIISSKLFHIESYEYIIKIIRKYLSRSKNV